LVQPPIATMENTSQAASGKRAQLSLRVSPSVLLLTIPFISKMFVLVEDQGAIGFGNAGGNGWPTGGNQADSQAKLLVAGGEPGSGV